MFNFVNIFEWACIFLRCQHYFKHWLSLASPHYKGTLQNLLIGILMAFIIKADHVKNHSIGKLRKDKTYFTQYG